MTQEETKILVHATRIKISSEFALLLKFASKSCIGKARDRMASEVPIKKSNLGSILKVRIGNFEKNLDGYDEELGNELIFRKIF